MAHKKGQGSSRNGRDSPAGKRRGVKVYGGETVVAMANIFGPPGQHQDPPRQRRRDGLKETSPSSPPSMGRMRYERVGKDPQEGLGLPAAQAKGWISSAGLACRVRK